MENSPSTKERLLNAACEIFAEKGFRDATVSEICEKAEANIAAVNYHFGDKESLYDRVWRHAFDIAVAAHPLDGDALDADASAEELLYSYASALLHRIFSETETGLFAKLLFREMAAPTLALDRIANEALLPQTRYLDHAVRQVLGENISEQQLWACKHSIIGQCAFFNFSRPLRERVIGKKGMNEDEIIRTARHIARFSLGGLTEIQKG